MTLKDLLIALTPARLAPYWRRIEASPLGYRLARGAFWSIAGGILSRSFFLLAAVVAARILGQERFGELGIVQSTTAMFAVFAGFGMGVTSTKHVAELRHADPQRAGRIITLVNSTAWLSGGAGAVLLYFSAPFLAVRALAAPALDEVLQLGALLLLFGAVQGALTGALAGLEAFRSIARMNFVSGVLSFPIVVGGAWWRGVQGAVAGYVVSAVVGCILAHLELRREARRAAVPLIAARWFEEWPLLWRFSFPAFLANLMVGPTNWAAAAMLVNRPNGYAEMGIFTAANQWFAAMLFIPGLLGQSVLPMMAERLGASDKAGGSKLLRTSVRINALLVIPIGLLLLASPTVMSWYGESFRSEWMTLALVLITAGLVAVQTPIGQMIIASGNIWPGFLMNLGWALVYLTTAGWLVHFGAEGLALARLIGYAAHAVWTFAFASRLLRHEQCRVLTR